MPVRGRAFGLSLAGLCAAVIFTAVFAVAGAAQSADSEYMPICNLPKCLNPQVTSKSGTGTANAKVEAKIALEDATKWCATISHETSIAPKSKSKAAGSDLEVSIEPARTARPVA